MKLKKWASAAALAVAGLYGGTAAQAAPIALELALVIDISGSISTAEYNRQRQGYQNAFLDATVQSNILSFADQGGIAVNVIQFGSNAAQSIGWTLLDSASAINTFAALIGSMTRLGNIGSSTDVEDGMTLAINSILRNSYEGARRVIDVSGDGHQNTDPGCSASGPNYNQACTAVQNARNNAATNGIRINGLAIEDGTYGATGLTNWYNTNVRTADGFVVTAAGFDDFERAVITKIGAEIIDQPPSVPEPATLGMLGVALAGLGFVRRRRA